VIVTKRRPVVLGDDDSGTPAPPSAPAPADEPAPAEADGTETRQFEQS
jgi:K(+)-stimulated pyrophosphate-energized sodium pump